MATTLSGGMPIRAVPFVVRRVGLKVHLKFRPAHRLHGNFLSHLVFVLAHYDMHRQSQLCLHRKHALSLLTLEQAIGVRPADFGIMPFAAGIASWF